MYSVFQIILYDLQYLYLNSINFVYNSYLLNYEIPVKDFFREYEVSIINSETINLRNVLADNEIM